MCPAATPCRGDWGRPRRGSTGGGWRSRGRGRWGGCLRARGGGERGGGRRGGMSPRWARWSLGPCRCVRRGRETAAGGWSARGARRRGLGRDCPRKGSRGRLARPPGRRACCSGRRQSCRARGLQHSSSSSRINRPSSSRRSPPARLTLPAPPPSPPFRRTCLRCRAPPRPDRRGRPHWGHPLRARAGCATWRSRRRSSRPTSRPSIGAGRRGGFGARCVRRR
mmetsp:Transcript_8392/g.22084  ORF Transcript_8392/g.22084 Transcript_8392/m.22084 type:complete len:223 (-) Transcript_8392:430-1098(-)